VGDGLLARVWSLMIEDHSLSTLSNSCKSTGSLREMQFVFLKAHLSTDMLHYHIGTYLCRSEPPGSIRSVPSAPHTPHTTIYAFPELQPTLPGVCVCTSPLGHFAVFQAPSPLLQFLELSGFVYR
jgi:hypothetical protein